MIVPAFNAEQTIVETITSICGQTLGNIEIIVVDDGSNDSMATVVEELGRKDRRILLLHQENAGVAAARNRGAAAARADRLAFIDADDLWHPDKLALQDQMMEERGAQIGLVYTWHCVIDEQNIMRRWSTRKAAEGWVLPRLLRESIVGNGSSAFIRRSVFKRREVMTPR